MIPRTKNEKPNGETTNSITNGISKKSFENGWNDTKKKWVRNCPKCGKEIHHTEKWVRDKFVRSNKLCKSCSNHNKIRGCLLESTKRILSLQRVGKRSSDAARLNMSKAQSGRKHSNETKLKMSGKNNGMYNVHRYGELNPFSGKRHTEESKRKMRIAAIERVKQRSSNGFLNNVNPKETEYFSKLEKERGWNGFYHGKNKQYILEDLGYFLDYYEPNLNVVVEYDEPRHYVSGQLRPKDVQRMENIISHLKCQFYRYNERLNELKQFA